ncbi:MAG: 2-hydroxy-3-oxopropionate reductase [Rhodocyclaceae bacterium]|jgi:2-hydroxy-3-oxopropionate reductase|nr:2-hydroxy-3-oxopropionate reductase [Rhodocyclaceae bacterium]
MNIGFIGLGLMGAPMARNLVKAGHTLHVWSRRPQTLAAVARSPGYTVHDSAAAVAAASEVVFTMVADSPDVHQVILGEQGVAEGGKPGLTVIDMSTIAPETAREVASALFERGIDFLDAPVSGGESGAINATLTIMVGGEDAVFARVKPLLELLGQSVTLIGGSGAGQVAKACNQIITGVGVCAVAEAVNFAHKTGVDAKSMREVLLGGFAASRILELHGQRMIERNFAPGFKAWMHQKDLRIVMDAAHTQHLSLPTAAAALQLYNGMVGSGRGEEDTTAMLKLFEQMSGIDSEVVQ